MNNNNEGQLDPKRERRMRIAHYRISLSVMLVEYAEIMDSTGFIYATEVVKIIKILIEKSISERGEMFFNLPGKKDMTLLMHISKVNIKVISEELAYYILLKDQSSLNLVDSGGNTAFMHAARCGNSDIFGVLNNLLADYSIQNREGDDVWSLAIKHDQISFLEKLFRAGIDISDAGKKLIMEELNVINNEDNMPLTLDIIISAKIKKFPTGRWLLTSFCVITETIDYVCFYRNPTPVRNLPPTEVTVREWFIKKTQPMIRSGYHSLDRIRKLCKINKLTTFLYDIPPHFIENIVKNSTKKFCFTSYFYGIHSDSSTSPDHYASEPTDGTQSESTSPRSVVGTFLIQELSSSTSSLPPSQGGHQDARDSRATTSELTIVNNGHSH